MKTSSNHLIVLIVIIGMLTLSSCSVLRQDDHLNRFLNQQCGPETLHSILSGESVYPAIAVENWIEAIIDYEIIRGNEITVNTKREQYYIKNESKKIDPEFKFGEIFSKTIKRKIDTSCPDITIGCHHLRVAYKFKQSNFNPTLEDIDLIIERDTQTFIMIHSHLTHPK